MCTGRALTTTIGYTIVCVRVIFIFPRVYDFQTFLDRCFIYSMDIRDTCVARLDVAFQISTGNGIQ